MTDHLDADFCSVTILSPVQSSDKAENRAGQSGATMLK
jgi:hypothetical protein